MSTPDFVILVLAALAGIAAAGGGIVLTLKTPKYAAARAAFCIAALCVFVVGVIWGATAEHSSMLARYAGAGVTAAIAAIGLVWMLTHLQGDKVPAISVFLECNPSTMPRSFPASGQVWFTMLQPQSHTEGQPLGWGMGHYFGSPNAEFGLPLTFAHECKVTNYSQEPLFNVTLGAVVTFREAIQNADNPNSHNSGAIVATKQGFLQIPKIEPNNPFVFYLQSDNPNFVDVAFLPELTFERSGEKEESRARLIFPRSMHINLSPVKNSEAIDYSA